MPRRAVLTRPQGRNEALAGLLAGAGWEVLPLPALALEPLPRAGPPPLPQDYDLVVFVSGNAARLYLDQATAYLTGGWPAATPIAVVGPASAQALRASTLIGADTTVLHPSADAAAHDSEALWHILSRMQPLRRVLLVRGTQGRDWLAERLVSEGAEVVRHALYRRRPAAWPAGATATLQAWASQAAPAVWLLTSGEGIAATAAAVRAADLQDWWRACRFVVTHPRLAEPLRAAAGGGAQAPMVKICVPADEAIFEAFAAV